MNKFFNAIRNSAGAFAKDEEGAQVVERLPAQTPLPAKPPHFQVLQANGQTDIGLDGAPFVIIVNNLENWNLISHILHFMYMRRYRPTNGDSKAKNITDYDKRCIYACEHKYLCGVLFVASLKRVATVNEELIKDMMNYPGVGKKITNCVLKYLRKLNPDDALLEDDDEDSEDDEE